MCESSITGERQTCERVTAGPAGSIVGPGSLASAQVASVVFGLEAEVCPRDRLSGHVTPLQPVLQTPRLRRLFGSCTLAVAHAGATRATIARPATRAARIACYGGHSGRRRRPRGSSLGSRS